MQRRIIREKQTIMDLALLMTGDVENCVELYLGSEGIGNFDELSVGKEIKSADVNNEVLKYYRLNDVSLATGYVDEVIPPEPDGIGYWIIEDTFIVQ